MLRKEYTKECKNCKLLPKEAITTQHRVLIAELEVKATRKRRALTKADPMVEAKE